MKADPNIDEHKIHLHPDKVARWLKTGDCYPIHIEIGATGRCDQRCTFCALDFVNHRGMDIETNVMINALYDMAKNEVRSVMFGGEGEPLLHPDIGLFVQKSKEYKMDVAITTNGSTFNQTKRESCLPYLSWIKFSIDAGNPENYAEVHGVNKKKFDILIKNIADSVAFKKENNLEVTIGTQFLIMPQSIDSVEDAARLLRDIEVDYLAVKPYSHHPRSNNNFVIDPVKYNELESKLESFNTEKFRVFYRKAMIKRIEEGNIYPECYGLPFISLVDSRGEVLPCNLFYDQPEYSYGNLYKNKFSEIWEGKKRKEVLAKLRAVGVEGCRHGCRCDAGNRYLDRLKNPKPHDNFT